jgi:hypothetical protein
MVAEKETKAIIYPVVAQRYKRCSRLAFEEGVFRGKLRCIGGISLVNGLPW